MVKSCFKKIVSSNGELFLDTFPSESCNICMMNSEKECERKNCPLDGAIRWCGSRNTLCGSVSICADYGRSKGFIADFDSITGSIKTLCTTRDEILRYKEEDSVRRIRRVLHNVRTINAHSLMEIRGIVPESFFKQHMKEAINAASNHITTNASRTAHGILEIAKDLFSIKTEFSVYDKLIKGDAALVKKPYNLRDVLMTVLYPFFGDFTNKNVFVDVQQYHDSVVIDFETIQIAFYHIIENTAKYVKPNTRVKIFFPVEADMQMVVFEMISLHIEEDEDEKIFAEHYSGKQAINANQHGEGIGLYRSKRLVEMNNGNLTVEAGAEVVPYNGSGFSLNRFLLSLPVIR